MGEWWQYDNLKPCVKGQGWHEASNQGDHPDDHIDFHVDLGGGHIPKARLNIDRSSNADVVMNLDKLHVYKFGNHVNSAHTSTSVLTGDTYYDLPDQLPFPDNSIESIISHHCLEHIGLGFVPLMDEAYRILKPKGKFRIIVPLYPSQNAYESTDHKRLFGPESFVDFCGTEGETHWHESFAEPYTKARFTQTECWYTPAPVLKAHINGGNQVVFDINGEYVGPELDTDLLLSKARELRVTLQK